MSTLPCPERRPGLLGVAALLAALPLAGCQVDLRPEPLQARTEPAHPDEARALLQAASDAQHAEGATPWLELPGVEVELTDAFYGLIGSVARPWPEDPQRLTFRFLPGQDSGVVTLLDDGEQVVWGLHQWNAWERVGSEPAEYVESEDITFWLPTLQYFLEMAFRLPQAELVDLAGAGDADGPAQQVYLTWVGYGPQETVDQYLAWIREEDGLLVRCAFTVRDVAQAVEGCVRYSDFRQVGDYLLPHTIEIGSDPPEDLLHKIQVHRWEPGKPLSREQVAPDPNRAPRPKPS
jgi:hypothetical protein